MKKLLASSLLAAFLVFSGAALAHPAGQAAADSKKSDASDKDKDKGKKGAKKSGGKKGGKKASSDTSSSDKKPSK